MNTAPVFCYTLWSPRSGMLTTRITGLVDRDTLALWRRSLYLMLDQIPAATEFKLLVDEYDYRHDNGAVHEEKKAVLPDMLAACDMVFSLLDAGEKTSIKQRVRPHHHHIRCRAMALLHHDKSLMEVFDRENGNDRQRYFSSREKAMQWLIGV